MAKKWYVFNDDGLWNLMGESPYPTKAKALEHVKALHWDSREEVRLQRKNGGYYIYKSPIGEELAIISDYGYKLCLARYQAGTKLNTLGIMGWLIDFYVKKGRKLL